ncbi:MAG: hypothetical protein JSR66_05835 [Proteobacteria bacterium]|nr:hypothetical protein [Pseudomonadota bacterium]
MSGNDKRRISSLRDLPQEIAPPRDLWKGIEAQIAAERQPAAGTPVPRSSRAVPLRVFAAAAVIVALAVGVWIGREMLPVSGGARPNDTGLTASNRPSDEPGAFHAAYVMGPKYINQRAQLVKDLESRLEHLPPPSRAKVLASLKAINDSKRDLERELGKDPSNALLQELLVNTYQDEMRVLTAVHEAGRPGEGI